MIVAYSNFYFTITSAFERWDKGEISDSLFKGHMKHGFTQVIKAIEDDKIASIIRSTTNGSTMDDAITGIRKILQKDIYSEEIK